MVEKTVSEEAPLAGVFVFFNLMKAGWPNSRKGAGL
jgi:hypothetical protein